MKKMKFGKVVLAMLAIMGLALGGCGGGGGSSTGNTNPAPTTATGRFVDAPVKGLNYVSGSQSGTTGDDGSFTYEVGKTVKFSIGDIELGEAPAQAIMTPITISTTANANANTPDVVARVQLLMSLSSTNPASGTITILPAIHTAAKDKKINFASNTLQADLATLVSTLDNTKTLANETDAKNHFAATLSNLNPSLPSLSQGLLIHFPFNGTIENKGSVQLTALQSPPSPSFVNGPAGQAYQFTKPSNPMVSTGSHFLWNAPPELAGDKISIAFWINVNNSSSSMVDICGVEDAAAFMNHGLGWDPNKGISPYDVNTSNFTVGYDKAFKSGALLGPRIFFNESVGFPGTTGYVGQRTFPSAGPDITTSKWVHVAFTRDKTNNQVRVWYDGVEGAGSQEGISIYRAFTSGAVFFLGRPNWLVQGNIAETFDPFYDGLAIDDFRVYGRLLSAEEISSLVSLK